ncbi:uncharacterized protein OCT59_001511 [Rhizophagus irregularis]|uniref:uncharacterized protein n=1 Tax=Rhizophagus irregularis TaxID=588596 RepID=UPI00331E45CC|nr:hypothetical protein OCT59_001511 [Rhizophagus irregularis]
MKEIRFKTFSNRVATGKKVGLKTSRKIFIYVLFSISIISITTKFSWWTFNFVNCLSRQKSIPVIKVENLQSDMEKFFQMKCFN